MGKRVIRILIAIVMSTALFGAITVTTGTSPSAAAATYVSKKYTAPKKGQSNRGVTALQRRLIKAKVLGSSNATGYYGTLTQAAVKRFQRKHGLKATGKVNRSTWQKLVAKTGTIKITSSSSSKGSKKLDRRCKFSGRALCIDKTRDKLYYVKNSRIIKTFDARFGCARTRTREGRFRVNWKSRHHVSTIYHTPMPYAMFFSGGQAVHYSSDFARRGYNGCSHGCVNIRNKSRLRWVFDRVHVGDRVIVYRS
ncbi:MAG: L,D-transpeptidase family protein [Microlunatus sp.]|nr:L,D-transpeptidase family protein [Microlunatus sp.]MDN5769428.1 L,D-transpeptidase family protein [Microlunatus sp.]